MYTLYIFEFSDLYIVFLRWRLFVICMYMCFHKFMALCTRISPLRRCHDSRFISPFSSRDSTRIYRGRKKASVVTVPEPVRCQVDRYGILVKV